MTRQSAINQIRTITKKYNWDSREEYQLEQVLKDLGKTEFESALVVKDAAIINELEVFVRERFCMLIFNHDEADGFFCSVQSGYFPFDERVADLQLHSNRKTLREAITAALEYLKKP